MARNPLTGDILATRRPGTIAATRATSGPRHDGGDARQGGAGARGGNDEDERDAGRGAEGRVLVLRCGCDGEQDAPAGGSDETGEEAHPADQARLDRGLLEGARGRNLR